MSGKKKIIVRGGQVYDHEGDVHKPKVADILIEGSEIVSVGPNLDAEGAEVIDAHNRLVVPGLINAHYHSHDTLCRGMFEELPLEFWLLYTLPLGANRSKEELRARTLVGALESIRCGITCVQDMLGLAQNAPVLVTTRRRAEAIGMEIPPHIAGAMGDTNMPITLELPEGVGSKMDVVQLMAGTRAAAGAVQQRRVIGLTPV